jgi:hypothetical protein
MLGTHAERRLSPPPSLRFCRETFALRLALLFHFLGQLGELRVLDLALLLLGGLPGEVSSARETRSGRGTG